MKRALVIPVALAIVAACCPAQARAARRGDVPQAVVKGNTAFALDLYARLKDKPGNLFLSPYSISTALAMTYAGARANTEAQMAKVLHFGLGQERLHGRFKALIGELNAGGRRRGYQLSVANALWGQQGYEFLDPFIAVTRDDYGSRLRQVDFKTAAEAARARINRWVEEQTNNKIKNLIPPGVLKPLTRLVLTNAIYFKSAWMHQFKEYRTKDAPFTAADGTRVTAPMMNQTRRFGYMETPAFQALSMPYAGYELSMAVFLPRKHDGLAAFEKSLTAEKLSGWLRQVRAFRKVRVYLPKFKMTSQFGLGEVLAGMGMPDAFSPADADFSGMNGKKGIPYGLFISAVIHKAFVDVNEKGTEAAAATAVVMAGSGVPRPTPIVDFRADHPFLFMIQHRRTGSILFMGRVANPKE